jgi:ribonuclease BN (tRNA processing enzyme)
LAVSLRRQAVSSDAVTLSVLGAGAAFSRRYGTTCSVLTLASGERWLIDCGRQAPEQLWHAGLSWHRITGQLVTHVHGDHVYGLEEFAFIRYYSDGDGVSAVLTSGPRPLLIGHTAVLSELWEVLRPSLRFRTDRDGNAVVGTLDDYFDVILPVGIENPIDQEWNHAETFSARGLDIVARETRHVAGKPSMCFEIALPGETDRIAWWSGDSVVDIERLERLEARTSVFFHDCTFAQTTGQVHGAFSDFERLSPSLRRKIVLMHHDDDLERYRPRAESLGFRLCMPGDVYDLVSGARLTTR